MSALATDGAVETLAREKMTRVLGLTRAQQLFDEILSEVGMPGIDTANQLLLFAKALARRPGFEGTLGTMLSVTAVLRGARDETSGRSER